MRALGEVTNPTGRLPAKEFDNRFRFHTAAQRWAAGMEAETPPLTGSDHVLLLVVAGTGAAMVWFVRKPNKRAAIVAGAVGTGLAALVAPQGPRTSRAHPEQQTRPSPRFKLLRAASIGEAAFLFPFCSRSPWRPRQKPLIAGIARNGAALYVFCVVSHANTAATRPAAYLPAGRHFFKEYPHARR